MHDRSFSFYSAGEPNSELERNLPVEIRSTGHELRSSRSYRWNNERHNSARYTVMQYTLAGRGRFAMRVEGKLQGRAVCPGEMFIAAWDKEFEYFYDGGAPWEFLWITLAGSFADQVARALREPSPVIEIPLDSPPLVFLKGLQERLTQSSRLDRYALTSLGYEFLIQLLKEKSESEATPESRFVAEARAFVIRNIRTAGVAALARHFGYSEKYFIDYFRRRASTTPNRFIVEERLRFASSLLVGTRKKIAAVAQESGFSEDNYFSKVFKRHRGMPPAEYRERNRDSGPVSEMVIL
jgi:AraC-like DNA-binding protein